MIKATSKLLNARTKQLSEGRRLFGCDWQEFVFINIIFYLIILIIYSIMYFTNNDPLFFYIIIISS